MEIACNRFDSAEEEKRIKDALAGRNSGLSSDLQKEYEKVVEDIVKPEWEEFKEKIDKINSIGSYRKGPNWVDDVIVTRGKPLVPFLGERDPKTSNFINRIVNAFDDAVVLLLGKGEDLPAFVTGFNGTGGRLSKFQLQTVGKPKDYLPTVQVNCPIVPTVGNLQKMLDGENPISPWGDKVEFHHLDQKPEEVTMVHESLHRGKGAHGIVHNLGKGEGLPPDARKEWNKHNGQRETLLKEMAKHYLKDWVFPFQEGLRRRKLEYQGRLSH